MLYLQAKLVLRIKFSFLFKLLIFNQLDKQGAFIVLHTSSNAVVIHQGVCKKEEGGCVFLTAEQNEAAVTNCQVNSNRLHTSSSSAGDKIKACPAALCKNYLCFVQH